MTQRHLVNSDTSMNLQREGLNELVEPQKIGSQNLGQARNIYQTEEDKIEM